MRDQVATDHRLQVDERGERNLPLEPGDEAARAQAGDLPTAGPGSEGAAQPVPARQSLRPRPGPLGDRGRYFAATPRRRQGLRRWRRDSRRGPGPVGEVRRRGADRNTITCCRRAVFQECHVCGERYAGAVAAQRRRVASTSLICSATTRRRAMSRRSSAGVFGGRVCPPVYAAPAGFRRVAQGRLEAADAGAGQAGLDPVHDAGSLAHQALTLAVRTPGVLLLEGRHRRHAAVARLAP